MDRLKEVRKKDNRRGIIQIYFIKNDNFLIKIYTMKKIHT